MDGDQTFAALVEGINYFGLSAKSSNTSPISTISSEHIQTVHLRMLLFKALLGCATLANVAYAQKVFAHFMVCPGHQFAARHNHSPKLNHATIRQTSTSIQQAQNSFSYSQQDWANDINTALSIGIDGFGNCSSPSIQVCSR